MVYEGKTVGGGRGEGVWSVGEEVEGGMLI